MEPRSLLLQRIRRAGEADVGISLDGKEARIVTDELEGIVRCYKRAISDLVAAEVRNSKLEKRMKEE